MPADRTTDARAAKRNRHRRLSWSREWVETGLPGLVDIGPMASTSCPYRVGTSGTRTRSSRARRQYPSTAPGDEPALRLGPAIEGLRVEKQALEGLGVPALELGATPAAIDDQQTIGLGTADRVQDVTGRHEVEALTQVRLSHGDP